MHILLVAPDRQQSLKFEQQLCSQGHVVSVSMRGFEALDTLRAGTIQMVVVDQSLTDLDTLDFVRIARKLMLAQYMYMMVLVERHDQKFINSVLDAGADDYMIKPVNPVELSLRIRHAERITSIDTRDEAIMAMAKLAESRDTTTGRHVERVRLYSREIAQTLWEMGHYFGQIDSAFVELIFRTAALHDLGKVAIPDSILSKPAKLTEHEFNVMKRHTLIGAETLASVITENNRCKFLVMGREIALCHHERWDGKGYPNGLAGVKIPLSARIVSVADVYDALVSARSYKTAYPHEEALRMIIEASDSQFDPLVVEAFAAIEGSINRIRQRECDPTLAIASAA